MKDIKRVYKVKYTYEDSGGIMSDVVDIVAYDKRDAEKEFYKLNPPLYKHGRHQGKGYVVDEVLNEKEYYKKHR